ncbi:oxidoreductase NAD-binding domain-containing protein 1 isoform X3 [Rattus norvegicus]|uniref:oxidoreductase NAD-binding domain-containing protein 1 isoform 3 n=1 Tax=Rattus norvegicus TaxID=10116 RepID=UPI00191776EE|nr:oxidoreductase NAD-binding domain-containing protein 1 isoform X3 [Rattus norvegicus]
MAHVLIPGLSRGSVGAICTQAASWALPTSTLRSLTLASVMRSRRKTDHLERTATVLRREVMAAAKVCEITHESPSVKSLRLLVADKDFSFKAGQWVDFFIPGVSVVGGFSICSSPQQLERERIIELAVKYTNHPPAVWVHNKKNILDLVHEFPEKIACSFHVTKQTTQISSELKPYVTDGRITEKEIREHISAETLFYVCGPPPMTDFFSKHLESSHVPKEHICFEKWW